jgi:effector-binding domain-containing protein
MISPCETVQQELQPTLFVRTRTPVHSLPETIDKGYAAVMQRLGALNEQPAGEPYVGYYNMDMQNLDVEMGFPVSRELPGEGEVRAGNLPAGRVATCVFTGPYNEMEPAYHSMSDWLAVNGYEPTGVVYEIYLNDPGVTPPQELMTRIVFPLKD